MRLTTFSDYALRVLMYAAATGDRLITIEETAKTYNVSRAHLMKVVNILTRTGYLKGVRGRSGGFTLAKPPEAINLGAVVRATEPDFALVECFATGNQCIITRRCQLPEVLNEALNAFVGTLDRYTLADVVISNRAFVAPKLPINETRGPIFKMAGAKHSSVRRRRGGALGFIRGASVANGRRARLASRRRPSHTSRHARRRHGQVPCGVEAVAGGQPCIVSCADGTWTGSKAAVDQRCRRSGHPGAQRCRRRRAAAPPHEKGASMSETDASASIFERIGGWAAVDRLVEAFYRRMDTLPEASGIRAMHAADLEPIKTVLKHYLAEWTGGPRLYSPVKGHPRLRQRHMGFKIGEAERDAWLLCMHGALQDAVSEPEARAELLANMAKLADWMRNQPASP